MSLSIRRLEHLTTDWTHHLSAACFSVRWRHWPPMLTYSIITCQSEINIKYQISQGICVAKSLRIHDAKFSAKCAVTEFWNCNNFWNSEIITTSYDFDSTVSPIEIRFRFRLWRRNWSNIRFRPGFGYSQSAVAQIRFRPKHYPRNAETAKIVKLARTITLWKSGS